MTASIKSPSAGAWTSGPLKAIGGLVFANGKPIASAHGVMGSNFKVSKEEAEANALLWAAAPALFQACLAAKNLLIKELDEPERTVFWQLVGALKEAGWSAESDPIIARGDIQEGA